jgi:PIN domain nuclease of toxin-antitoxin system
MNLLLDTHALVWALFEPDRLTDRVRSALLSSESILVVSVASIWEIGIKHRLGKLAGAAPLLADVEGALQRMQARALPITMAHVCRAASWKSVHRDPFDRMLAAQASVEKLSLVTADVKLSEFAITTFW